MRRLLPSSFYYYGPRKYAEAFVERGVLSFGPSTLYENEALTTAQRDIEHRRVAQLSGPGLRVRTGPNPTRLRDVPDVRLLGFDVRLPPYFIRSFTNRADAAFRQAFGETCVRVADGPELVHRVGHAVSQRQLLLKWRFVADIVHYQAQSDALPMEDDDLLFVKNKIYAWQDELRFVLVPEFNYVQTSPNARVDLILGPLSDICVLDDVS